MRNHSKKPVTLLALGVSCIAVACGVFSCGTTGHVNIDTEVDPPGPIGPTKIGFGVGNDGSSTYTAENDSPPACVELTWSDASGMTISTESVIIPGSGPVPPGAVRWEVAAGDCPDDEEELLFGGGSQQIRHHDLSGFTAYPGPKLKRYHVYGGPIVPDDSMTNVSYSFHVFSYSPSKARQRVQAMLNGGIGSNVPPGIVVHYLSEMEATPFGARFRTASNTSFESYTFGFNGDPMYADLATGYNVLRYDMNGWDVLETVVPLSDFDYGVMPGVWYSNTGSITTKTAAMSEPANGSFTLGYNW